MVSLHWPPFSMAEMSAVYVTTSGAQFRDFIWSNTALAFSHCPPWPSAVMSELNVTVFGLH